MRCASKRAAGRRRRSAPSALIRRSVPVRTFADWDDPAPGFVEADLVAHSGPTAKGSFVQTLVLTDIATGWTECAPLLVREQRLLIEVLTRGPQAAAVRAARVRHGQRQRVHERDRAGLLPGGRRSTFTRCRPYRKNDQAWVEQKNGAVVRRIVGYRRFEGLEAAAALARLYASVRLFVNFFQPSFKLAEKDARWRAGAGSATTRRRRRISGCWRIARTPEDVRRRLRQLHATLDPVRLLQRHPGCAAAAGRDRRYAGPR